MDASMSGSISLDIVNAVADAKGVGPADLEYALQDYIETDALDQLAAHEDSSWTLSFELPDHSVTVTSEGGIFVDGRETRAWAVQ